MMSDYLSSVSTLMRGLSRSSAISSGEIRALLHLLDGERAIPISPNPNTLPIKFSRRPLYAPVCDGTILNSPCACSIVQAAKRQLSVLPILTGNPTAFVELRPTQGEGYAVPPRALRDIGRARSSHLLKEAAQA